MDTPWRRSSTITTSIDGGFSPRGNGSHGFVKTSPMAASRLSFDCSSWYTCVKRTNAVLLELVDHVTMKNTKKFVRFGLAVEGLMSDQKLKVSRSSPPPFKKKKEKRNLTG